MGDTLIMFDDGKDDILIWVDENDNITGYGAKMETHEIDQLHRAFSAFIYDEQMKELLLQRRADGKYHSGGKWSNTCCSHPRQGEELEDAVPLRIRKELGFDVPEGTPVEHKGSFIYRADLGGIFEHEYDHVFVIRMDKDKIPLDRFDRNEISDLKWVATDIIDEELKTDPDKYSAWFARAYRLSRSE